MPLKAQFRLRLHSPELFVVAPRVERKPQSTNGHIVDKIPTITIRQELTDTFTNSKHPRFSSTVTFEVSHTKRRRFLAHSSDCQSPHLLDELHNKQSGFRERLSDACTK